MIATGVGVLRFACWSCALLFLALPARARAESTAPGDETERNRKLLEQIRSDPEHMRRLLAEFQSFQSLPKARQEQLRQLDHALNQADPATQQRLWGVLERYFLWLESLPEADRKRVEEAGSKSERLKVIQEIRDRQWLERQPRRDREEILKLPEEQRAAEIARLRREDRRRRLAWQKALQRRERPAPPGVPRPARLADCPAEVRTFVEDRLMPMLTEKERAALDKAAGRWPGFLLTLLELSERHPVLPPPHTRPGVTLVRDLPPQTRAALNPGKGGKVRWAALRKVEGSWPEFALAVTELARREGKTLPQQLGACRPAEFSEAVQRFLETQLTPALSDAEKRQVKEAEGKWPEYPRLLHELAQAHKLVIPGMSLPGPRDMWAAARAALPDVPDRVLREFVLVELSEQERSRLNLSVADPASRDRIKQEYFRRHPNQLKRYRGLAVDKTAGP